MRGEHGEHRQHGDHDVSLESAEHWLSALTSLNPAKLQEGFDVHEGPGREKTNRNVRKRRAKLKLKDDESWFCRDGACACEGHQTTMTQNPVENRVRRRRSWNEEDSNNILKKINYKEEKEEEVPMNKMLKALKAVNPEGLNGLDQNQKEWICVKFAVDSGATDTVMNEDELECVETKEGWAKKRGIEYEVANGLKIPNEGEKEFTGTTEEGVSRMIKAQVCAVTKSLMSVRRIVNAGHRVVFDAESFIEDTTTGERMYLEEEEGMYVLNMWVHNEGF